MLAITTYCTKNYTFAITKQISMVVAALHYAGFDKCVFIMAGDNSLEVRAAFSAYEKTLKGMGVTCERLVVPSLKDNGNNQHQKEGNLSIAAMQSAAWTRARELNADELWSLESDILPQPKVLRVMRGIVALDDWYDVVMCTYPNDAFLGGHGSPQNWILPSVYDDERKLTPAVEKKIAAKKAREKQLTEKKEKPTPKDIKAWEDLKKEIATMPPLGNVFALNARGWRRRGWFESAYPGIGLGAVLPTQWVGLGCTYMSKKALSMANFEGYEGGSTQDLWLSWRVWNANGIRMAVTSHAICSHVKRRRDKTGKVETVLLHARHDVGGESHGHLRVERKPWK